MSGAIKSSFEVVPCSCEESMQLRHKNNSLQEQLQYLTEFSGKDETLQELMSLEQNKVLRQKNDRLRADNKKLREEIEILKGRVHQHQQVDNGCSDSLEPSEKDKPTEKKEISEAEVQTEDLGAPADQCPSCTNIKALQAEFDRLRADQQELLFREVRYKQEIEEIVDRYRKATEQNEKLSDEIENQRMFMDQTFRSLADSIEEALPKQEEDDQMIVNVQKKLEPRTCGSSKPLLVSLLVTVAIVFFASLVFISANLTDPNAPYNRRQYI